MYPRTGDLVSLGKDGSAKNAFVSPDGLKISAKALKIDFVMVLGYPVE